MTKRRLTGFLSAIICLITASAALAQQQPHRARYDGCKVIRAEINSMRNLRTMLALSPDPWSHGVRLGRMDFLIPPSSLAALERSGIRYTILNENVQAMLDAELARRAARAPAPGREPGREPNAGEGGVAGEIVQGWFDDYRDYAEVNQYLDDLAALRPDLAEVIEVGASLENRTIYGLRISGPDIGDDSVEKPAVLFNGCQHAREWVAVMVPMYLADTLIKQYDLDPAIKDIVDRVEFFIVPIVNPDGYQFSWDDNRLWRKNRRPNENGTFGVDLNRNWGYEWGGEGSSGNPGNETYRGTAPFSEPESAALRDLFQANPQIAAHIDFHSYSQLVLQPWGYTGDLPDDFPVLNLFGTGMAQTITSVFGMPYASGPAYTILYPASGVVIDWTYGDQGVLAFTTELRDTGEFGFVLPPNQITPTAQENLPAALELADWISQAVLFSFPSGLPNEVEAGEETAVTVSLTAIAPTALDPDSAKLFTRAGGSEEFLESDLSPVGLEVNLFEGALPAAECGAVIEYFFQVQTERGTIYRSPTDAPAGVHAADVIQTQTTFEDDFESDLGWTVGAPFDSATSAGVWVLVDPLGSSAQPSDDNTPGEGTMCFVTGQGAAAAPDGSHDVDGGSTTLTSPLLDAGSAEDAAIISYARWYSNNLGASPDDDSMLVEISDDGGKTWTLLEEVATSTNAWVEQSFAIADFVPGAAQVMVRFIASDFGGGSLIEAAVDDVRIAFVGCEAMIPGDLDGNAVVDGADLGLLLLAWGQCATGGTPVPPCPADLDGDGAIDGADLGMLLLNWTE